MSINADNPNHPHIRISPHPNISTSAHLHIFLLGMMGSGKSYWACLLSAHFNFINYDLDILIEESAGKTIAEIFSDNGENYFRQKEKETLHSTAHFKSSIISTGGGTPCFFDNMQWMNTNGITIWIDEDVDTLAARLKTETAKRPLIKNLDDDELKIFLKKKYDERKPFYEQAQYHLTGENISLENFKKIIQQYV